MLNQNLNYYVFYEKKHFVARISADAIVGKYRKYTPFLATCQVAALFA